MYPYVAFVSGGERSPCQITAHSVIDRFRQLHPEWEILDGGQGLMIFHLPPSGRLATATILSNGGGVVLGSLFRRDGSINCPDDAPIGIDRVSDDIAITGGRYLVDHYWGGYVAFIHQKNASWRVLRDCSGQLPCYLIDTSEVAIFVSSIGYLAGMGLPAFSMNVHYVAGFVHSAEITRSESAVNGISEVLAGNCVELTATGVRQISLWNPYSWVQTDVIEDFDTACSEVRRVTQFCIDHWASRFDRIVHRLSGGLDSSVVLGCLKHSPHCPRIVCWHMESGGADDQECAFARLAAEEAGFELVVQSAYSAHAAYDERLFCIAKAPNPSVAAMGMALDPEAFNLVPVRVNAEAVWDGEGGDHLFFQPRSAIGAVDYAFSHGVGKGFVRSLQDAARVSRSSYWHVLPRAIWVGAFKGAWHSSDQRESRPVFLNPEIVPPKLPSYAWHPWSDEAMELPPGKRWQIGLLGRVIHRHRPVPELQYVGSHHPLLSQPLFELCLRIPLYVLLQGGVSRAVERAAFGDCVPTTILSRQNKGGVATALMRRIRGSLPYVRDLLLDGVLVRERILLKSDLEPYLAFNKPIGNQTLWPLLSSIAAEVWARKWETDGWCL